MHGQLNLDVADHVVSATHTQRFPLKIRAFPVHDLLQVAGPCKRHQRRSQARQFTRALPHVMHLDTPQEGQAQVRGEGKGVCRLSLWVLREQPALIE